MAIARRALSWLPALNRAIPLYLAAGLSIYGFMLLLPIVFRSPVLDGWAGIIALFTLIGIGYLPAIIVHELGHAITAQMLGWRVWQFAAGPFVLSFRPRLSLRLGAPGVIDAGGFVVVAPRTAHANAKWRDIMVHAGGPIFSAGAAIALYPAAIRLSTGNDVEMLIAGALGAFCATSMGCAVLTLWPHADESGRANDALKIFREARTSQRPDAITYAYFLSKRGFAAKDFDPWIAEAAAAHEAANAASAGFLEALKASDTASAAAIAQALGGDHASILNAYLFAFVEDDPSGAEMLLSSVKTTPGGWAIGRALRELTLAALHAADGEREAAAQRIEQLARALAEQPAPHAHWPALIAHARARLLAAP